MNVNLGSGQRRFTSIGETEWINIDSVSRPPDQVPDILCDPSKEPLPFKDGELDMVAFVHCLEHFGCGEAMGVIQECHRVLRPAGSLVVIVPDMKALAERWIAGGIDDFIFFVNCYGAYQGEEGDRHRWGYTYRSLVNFMYQCCQWDRTKMFDYRAIPGSDYPRDWWMLALECIK